MNKINIRISIYSLILAGILSGCNDDSSSDVVEPPGEIVVNPSWQYVDNGPLEL